VLPGLFRNLILSLTFEVSVDPRANFHNHTAQFTICYYDQVTNMCIQSARSIMMEKSFINHLLDRQHPIGSSVHQTAEMTNSAPTL
jgi:hypothetical protein